jgi:hypothetical protein
MAAVNPQRLMQAAMAAGGSGGAPQDSMQIPGAASAAGGSATGPQGGLQDSLPTEFAGAQPVGAENSGVLSTAALQNQMGVGTNQADAGQATAQTVAQIQSPQVPPNQKAMLQQQLQLAALRALTRGPSGAAGTPQS